MSKVNAVSPVCFASRNIFVPLRLKMGGYAHEMERGRDIKRSSFTHAAYAVTGKEDLYFEYI